MEFAGIWITSLAIAFAVWLASSDPDVFFTLSSGVSVLAYYSLNHILDDSSPQTSWKQRYQVVFGLSAAALATFILLNPPWLIRYFQSWPAGLMAVLYLLIRRQETRMYAWVRALLVSGAAAVFLSVSAAGYSKNLTDVMVRDVQIFLVCWINVLISSLLDRPKDRLQQRVMLTDDDKVKVVSGLIMAGIAGIFILDAAAIWSGNKTMISGSGLYALIILGLLIFRHAAPLWVRRWTPDAFLWLCVL